MVVAAVVIGIIAAIVVVMWAKNGREAAYKNAELTEAFVVRKEIPKGLSGDQASAQQYIARTDMPQEYRPGSAIRDINDIKKKVALYSLAPGQVVVSGMFVDQAEAQVTTAQNVEAGQVAVSFSFDQVRAVGGHLTPGDKVDVFVTYKEGTGTDNGSVRLLYQNVKIMAIGARMAAQAGDTTSSQSSSKSQQQQAGDAGIITFAIPAKAAQRMIYSATDPNMSLYLGLVPPDNTALNPVPEPTGRGNVFTDVPSTPYEEK